MEIVKKSVLTVGGNQEQFLGVRMDGFLLCPDSDTGTRPDALRVEGPEGKVLLIHGGTTLQAEIHATGIDQARFLRKLTADQRGLLMAIAWDLPGRAWPMAGEMLQKRLETAGEENVILALRNLFRGVK